MIRKDSVIEEPLTEEDVPLWAAESLPEGQRPDLELARLQDQISDNQHKRFMNLREFDSIFKLLGWCIFLALLTYLLSFFKSTSLSGPFFELMKTIIVAVVGYLLGQKLKNGS